MATPFGMDDPFVLEQQRAQAALQKAQEQQQYRSPQGPGMVGNVYVGSSPLQHVAELLRVYKGGQQAKEAESKLADIGARRNQAMADVLRGYTEKMTGAPEKRTEVPSQMFVADDAGGGEMTMGTNTQVTPAVAPNPMAANQLLMASQFPQFQQMGMEKMMTMQEKQAADAETRAKQDQQRQLWEKSGGNPQAFIAAGGDIEFAKTVIDGQGLGQPTVARTVETVDSRGRKVVQQLDARGNPVGAPIAAYTPPPAPREPKAPNVIQTASGPMILNSDGTARPITGADGRPVQGAKSETTTEGERKAGTLLTRLRGSQAQLADVTAKNPSAASPSLIGQTLSGMGMETAGNLLTSSDRQRVNAAQLDLLDAALTLGTGAAYTREQLEGYRKSFFPQIGDSAATIKDKEDRLKNVIASAEIAAGRSESQSVPQFGPGATRPGPTPQNLPQGRQNINSILDKYK